MALSTESLHAHTSTLKVSSLGSLDTDFGAGVSSSATSVVCAASVTSVISVTSAASGLSGVTATAEALLLRGILRCVRIQLAYEVYAQW